jgi:organic hydroperoxide reductase OsmC/OhrA
MSQHRATISWRFDGGEFARGRYSREHTWRFDGGAVVAASPSPSVVRAPYSNPAAVDPEEAFVAAIASCHMLTFLHLASRRGFEVAAYDDDAVGEMTKNERGTPWVSQVVLSPRIEYRGDKVPTPAEVQQLHEEAHRECFISNSVKTAITVSPP